MTNSEHILYNNHTKDNDYYLALSRDSDLFFSFKWKVEAVCLPRWLIKKQTTLYYLCFDSSFSSQLLLLLSLFLKNNLDDIFCVVLWRTVFYLLFWLWEFFYIIFFYFLELQCKSVYINLDNRFLTVIIVTWLEVQNFISFVLIIYYFSTEWWNNIYFKISKIINNFIDWVFFEKRSLIIKIKTSVAMNIILTQIFIIQSFQKFCYFHLQG